MSVTEMQLYLTHGRREVRTKLSEGYEHATGNQDVWFGAYHWEKSYGVLVCLLASQLRGQEQSVFYPDPSTKGQTETLGFCCVSAQTASHKCHEEKV